MHCRQASSFLQLYIDHKLTANQMRSVEAHLAYCVACQRELFLLEAVAYDLSNLKLVAEPENLTTNIMQRVAMSSQRREENLHSVLRPSWLELMTVVLLATIATLGITWGQPSLRAVLPFANGHDFLSLAFLDTLHTLVTSDIAALTLVLWVGGTLLGICITLALAGSEMRNQWFKAMMERLPVR